MANTPTTTMRLDPELKDQAMRVLELCFVKFLWAVSAFLLVRLSGCF